MVDAPVGAPLVTLAPTPPAPWIATTPSCWSNPPAEALEVIVMPDNATAASAFQTSLSPGCALLRFTIDQVIPPPETVAVCPADLFGPSELTKASSCSPAADVENPATDADVFPMAETCRAIVMVPV